MTLAKTIIVSNVPQDFMLIQMENASESILYVNKVIQITDSVLLAIEVTHLKMENA